MSTQTEIEAALLGAILTENKQFDACLSLTPEMFEEPAHGEIFRAIADLLNDGKTASPLVLKTQFEDLGPYLFDIVAECPSIANAPHYAEKVHDGFLRRSIRQICHETADLTDSDKTAEEILAEHEEFLLGLVQTSAEGPEHISSIAERTMDQIQSAMKGEGGGLPTGLRVLDDMIGGLKPGYLYVVAGATSMGKSALAGAIADFNAAQGKSVTVSSLEMKGEQLLTRWASRMQGIPIDRIERGKISPDEANRLMDSINGLKGLKLHINAEGIQHVSSLRHQCRRIGRKFGLDLLVVDYLQLLLPPAGRRSGTRTEEVATITRTLKSLAQDFNIPVIAVSQLSREVDRRDDHRPRLSDLRESGSIEQDADVVMFVFREEKYLLAERPDEYASQEKQSNFAYRLSDCKGKAEIIVAKQRQGPLGECMVGFRKETAGFFNLDGERNAA